MARFDSPSVFGRLLNARQQQQLDVLGEVLDAAFLLRSELGTLDRPVRDMLVTLANRAAGKCAEPDTGMWEARGKQRQYVSSKVMCWMALDRAIQLAPVLGPDADPTRWALARDEVHAAVLDQVWSSSAWAYAGAFASDDLDASVLVAPIVGFLPATDERMLAWCWSPSARVDPRVWAGPTPGPAARPSSRYPPGRRTVARPGPARSRPVAENRRREAVPGRVSAAGGGHRR